MLRLCHKGSHVLSLLFDEFPSNILMHFFSIVFERSDFLESSEVPVVAFGFGGSPYKRLSIGVQSLIEFERFLSTSLSLYCCISTIFAIMLKHFLFVIPLFRFAVINLEGKLRNWEQAQRLRV